MSKPIDPTAATHAGRDDLACDHCGARVLVSKNSMRHTSIQWNARALDTCLEFAAAAAAGESIALIATCSMLRDSIERAVREGRLAVGSDSDVGALPDVVES